MRRARQNTASMTLVELMVAILILAVLLLAGWTTWTLGWRGVSDSRNKGDAAQTVFGVLQTIEQDIHRASAVQVPDPDHPSVSSIQMYIPSSTSTVRRAYRLENGAVISDRKDEGPAAYTAFENVSALTFTVLDPPENKQVSITCTADVYGQQSQMQTIVRRRN
jgi:type II secretory pathway component PulJ